MKKFISRDESVLGGTPVVSGTRVPVSRILHLLARGYSVVEIIETNYPHVTIDEICGALKELARGIK